jgi:hypothetical protein
MALGRGRSIRLRKQDFMHDFDERRHPLGHLLDLVHDPALCLACIRCLPVRLPPRPLHRMEVHQRLV